mmetsp:Transcript_11382/g.24280  ORF Transcript_11382/g.24280 Transcript_11382/m.24280 type:complete len:687 (-) Transcript_11382:83-2143(-)
MPPSKGLGVVKTGGICIAAYLLGVALSPHILPIDFLTSKLQHVIKPAAAAAADGSSNNVAATSIPAGSSPTPASPPVKLPKKQPGEPASLHEPSYKSIVNFDKENDPFHGVDFVVHRNGEPDPCSRQKDDEDEADLDGALSPASLSILRAADHHRQGQKPLDMYDKYDVDAVLTHAFAVGRRGESLLEGRGESCGATWKENDHYIDSAPHLKDVTLSAMIKYCDMGLYRTTIQLDFEKNGRVPEIGSWPCHFHTREGLRVASLKQLVQLARDAPIPGQCTEEERNVDGTCGADKVSEGGRRELHLYAVQMGRNFIFAPKYVGEIFELPHVKVPQNLPVWLEVISLEPRVFDVFNFFDRGESAAIVEKALKETAETHRIKRSSTGASGYNVNSQRTSENGFDTHGKQAQAVKRRCMSVLGFDTYEESLTDGLQVLRYNKTTAYIPHLDWIDDYQKQQEHDFDTEHLGSNRFATILLYMSDLEEWAGGETVFSHGWPPNQPEEDRVQFQDALEALRNSGDVSTMLKKNSWEEKMVARCRSRLNIRPHSSRAVLFYSQNPDGTPDNNSMHGGCPVIHGEKWAANLWVWNAPRSGFPGSPKNQEVVDRNRAAGKSPDDGQKKATFTNTKTDERMRNADLYFQDTFWSKFGFQDTVLHVNTYEGHQWNVKVGDNILKTFVIDKKPNQMYSI